MSRGDQVYTKSSTEPAVVLDRRHRPMRRGAYLAVVLLALFAAVAWLSVAFTVVFAAEPPPIGALCCVVSAGLLLVGALLPVAFRRRRARRVARDTVVENENAVSLLRVGRYDEAAEIWERIAADARWLPYLHALYVCNLGMSALYRGDPTRALALIDIALSSKWIGAVYPNVLPQIENGRALACAVLGDLERAEAHRNAALAHLSEHRRLLTLLTDTLIAARRGTLTDTPTDETLHAAEAVLPPSHIRGVRLLHAFARASGEGSYRKSEHGRALDVKPGELDFLAARWPELRAFMEVEGMLRTRSDSA